MAIHNYVEILEGLLASEGGYTNDAGDDGGPTNFGITIHDCRKYVKPDCTADDMRNFQKSDALAIYRERYWDAVRGDELPSGIDYTVFDYGVNSGVARPPKIIARLLHMEERQTIDDDLLAAIKDNDVHKVIDAINDERLAFMKVARNKEGMLLWPKFGKGWGRRVVSVRARSHEMADAAG